MKNSCGYCSVYRGGQHGAGCPNGMKSARSKSVAMKRYGLGRYMAEVDKRRCGVAFDINTYANSSFRLGYGSV